MRGSRIVGAMLALASMLAMAIPVSAAPRVATIEVKGMACSA